MENHKHRVRRKRNKPSSSPWRISLSSMIAASNICHTKQSQSWSQLSANFYWNQINPRLRPSCMETNFSWLICRGLWLSWEPIYWRWEIGSNPHWGINILRLWLLYWIVGSSVFRHWRWEISTHQTKKYTQRRWILLRSTNFLFIKFWKNASKIWIWKVLSLTKDSLSKMQSLWVFSTYRNSEYNFWNWWMKNQVVLWLTVMSQSCPCTTGKNSSMIRSLLIDRWKPTRFGRRSTPTTARKIGKKG